MKLAPALLAAALSLVSAGAPAAELRIQNTNAAGQGFNDASAAVPVGLNFGTSIGALQVIDFQFAAAIWGATLKSSVPIIIDAAFVTPAQDPNTTCNATSGLLGFTSPVSIASGAGFPNSQAGYVSALASAIRGQDVTPGQAHIKTRFNAAIGTPGCLSGISWYYGLDGAVPAGQVSLLATLLHEFAHGLGFTSLVDPNSGNLTNSLPAIFDFHVFDEVGQSTWAGYSAARRAPLLTAGNELAWDGANVAAGISTFLGPTPALSFAGGGSTTSSPFAAGQFSGPIPDGGGQAVTSASPLDACSDLLQPGSLTGNIALIERGTCNFYDKALRAQAAGAAGVVVFDNDAGPLVTMASPDGGAPLGLPSVFITNQDGQGVLNRLDGGTVTASFGFSPQISNTDPTQQRVLLYTPKTVSGGSTLSHWNSGSFPHSLLMEPFIGATSQINLDLTPAAMSDMGWQIVTGLSVGMSKALDPTLADGGQGTYLIAVFNRRATAVDNVQLDLTLPSGSTFVSAAGGCSALPCSLGTVGPSEVRGVVVTVKAPSPTVFPYVVTANLSAPGTTAADNLSASISAAQGSGSLGGSTGGGGGCSTGGVPFALVGLLVVVAGMRARRRA